MVNPGQSEQSKTDHGNAVGRIVAGDAPHDSGGIANRVMDAASSAATSAAATLEGGRAAVTEAAKSAADYASRAVGDMPGADTVQRGVSAAADYFGDADVSQMADDMKTLVKRNPGPALLGAAILGFLIGRSLSR